MKILDVRCVDHCRGYNVYLVMVDEYKRKESYNRTIFRACDPYNFGGDVLSVDFVNCVYLVRVKIYID